MHVLLPDVTDDQFGRGNGPGYFCTGGEALLFIYRLMKEFSVPW